MGNHQFLVGDIIRTEQIGITGIGVDHHFIDFLQPVRIAFHQLIVLCTEPPVRISNREPAIGGKHTQLFIVQNFKDRLEEVQAVIARMLFHLLLDIAQLFR